MRLLGRRRKLSAPAEAYRDASPSPRSTPWRNARFAVVDLETTGLDPRSDEIVSFASVPIDAGRISIGGVVTATIRPRQMPSGETIRIHGLRPIDLAEAPALPDVLDRILDALSGRHLVAHVAWVERRFLEAALRPMGLRVAKPILDTAAIARHVLDPAGEQRDRPEALGDAARRLGLPVHRPHIAEGDALTTAQLFLALAAHLDLDAPQTVGSLAQLSRG
jgi:DNA polymerase III subunit epsilon